MKITQRLSKTIFLTSNERVEVELTQEVVNYIHRVSCCYITEGTGSYKRLVQLGRCELKELRDVLNDIELD